MTMNVKQLIKELTLLENVGYGNSAVVIKNLDEYIVVNYVSPNEYGDVVVSRRTK